MARDEFYSSQGLPEVVGINVPLERQVCLLQLVTSCCREMRRQNCHQSAALSPVPLLISFVFPHTMFRVTIRLCQISSLTCLC